VGWWWVGSNFSVQLLVLILTRKFLFSALVDETAIDILLDSDSVSSIKIIKTCSGFGLLGKTHEGNISV
jgi:hypothetical protein